MVECKKCGKKCEKDYCFHCKPKKGLSRGHLKAYRAPQRHYKPKDDVDVHLMQKFFLQVWNKRKEHRCEECNQSLGREPLSYMFDHILEKQRYPQLKFEEENIQYLCLLCHDKKTRGFISEKINNKIVFVKNKFNIFDE
jgi:hypothetical protein